MTSIIGPLINKVNIITSQVGDTNEFQKLIKGINSSFQKGLIDEPTYTASVLEVVDIIKGGKKAQVGEVRDFAGKKYQKQQDGSWKEVGKKKGNDDIKTGTRVGHISSGTKGKTPRKGVVVESTDTHHHVLMDDTDEEEKISHGELYNDDDEDDEEDKVTDEQRKTIQDRMRSKMKERDEEYKNKKK